LVGSVDAHFCKYASVLRYQEASLEWIHDLSEMVVDILKIFYHSTGTKPQRILVYRNGILAKQSRSIASKELNLIRNALEYLENGYDPQITFVSVQKRHHAKFFPFQSEFLDKSGNIVPGTLIDSDVTVPGEFDFYLASHPGLQGTSKPSYYHVLHDENNFTADTLQTLTCNIILAN
jgi:eukaryotic translation initiation factor 2C